MMLYQSFKMALKSIAGNKMRSFLTMLGVIIGVMAVVVLVSIGQGANSSVVESIEGTPDLSTPVLKRGLCRQEMKTGTVFSLITLSSISDSPSLIRS